MIKSCQYTHTHTCQIIISVMTNLQFIYHSDMSACVWNALPNKIDSNTSRAVFKDKLKLLLNNELVLSYHK